MFVRLTLQSVIVRRRLRSKIRINFPICFFPFLLSTYKWSNDRLADRTSGGDKLFCRESVVSIPSNDLPIDRASPDAPPKPGVAAARTNSVIHKNKPNAEPSANHMAASLKDGDNKDHMILMTVPLDESDENQTLENRRLIFTSRLDCYYSDVCSETHWLKTNDARTHDKNEMLRFNLYRNPAK